jgi:hypothetical protein
MFQFAIQTPVAAVQAAEATDTVTPFFLLLTVGALVVVVLGLFRVGDLGTVITTVGSVISAVVIITVVALMLFVVLLALRALLAF